MTVAPVHSGHLRFRIEIQRPVRSQNRFGEVDITWETEAIRWANITFCPP